MICIMLPAIQLINRYMWIRFYFKIFILSYMSVFIEAAYQKRLLVVPVVVSLSEFEKPSFRRMPVLPV